jgi:hypothetical protein
MAGTAFAQEPPPGAPPAAEPTPAAAPPSGAAPAAASGAFGQVGQIAIMTTLDDSMLSVHPDASFVHMSQSGMGSAPSTNSFSLVPTGHYFVIPNLSVSAGLIIQHGPLAPGTDVNVTTLGLMVGAGYNLYLMPNLSIWPQLQIGYAHGSATVMGVDASLSTVPLIVSVPFLYHPVEHFFLGLAPILRTQLTDSESAMGRSVDLPKQTDLGITGVIGGYFSL